ncbi:hypothetical protein M0802_004162 [Mischocyttarus mexicanus]|nr:hypothetical protein M0802_004162 [Mischocyttarus mexicanus]
MYAVDGAALLDALVDTKQPDEPRYPATGASSGRIYSRLSTSLMDENCPPRNLSLSLDKFSTGSFLSIA